jgi:hypothetical protein
MAFRDRVDAGRQIRRTLGHPRDSDVLAWGELRGRQGRRSRVPAIGNGDRAGRVKRAAQHQRRPGTHAPTGLRRVSAAPRARVQLTQLPREFSQRLDGLQQRVAAAKADVQAAATESREQIGKGIDQARGDLDRAVQNAQQQAEQAADRARTKWAQMKADAAAKMEDVKAKIDKRNRQMDAKLAARDADWADTDAADAIDFAEWAVDTAELAILDAIDARAYADQLARAAGS